MKSSTRICLAILVVAFGMAACRQEKPEEAKVTSESALDVKIRRFAPTEITADVSRLSESDRKALGKILEAATYYDPLFRRQVWSGNDDLLKKLKGDTSPDGQARLHYFKINAGPWSRLDKNEPFIDGVPHEKPAGAGFYPDGMTKDEFNSWAGGLPDQERTRATGFFYVIRRGPDGKLTTVPYSQEYREFLEPAARLLREAADLTSNATLKKFLTLRAEAFSSDDYYASDVAWMELDSPIDVTIGPYETYEDEMFNYKASFESYVTLRDDNESAKLAKFSGYLQDIEDNLPIDERYRNPKLGAAAPIRVVDEVFASGEGNLGVQTAAFNLPNDERVVKEKGSKRVMLKNVQEAKFNKTLVPISKVVLDQDELSELSFDAFFTHILAHELMHGLGPHNITVAGKPTTVRMQLKELYSAIEEAKADITGLFALQHLIDKGAVDRGMERAMYTTFLASAFRSVRFGITEAHGKGVALQFNYLMDEGAFTIDESKGTFRVDFSRIKEAVRKLAHDIMTLQAKGSYDEAKAMLDKYGVVRPQMQKAFDRLTAVPVDIEPQFPLIQKLGVTDLR
jgi:Peptidase family M49